MGVRVRHQGRVIWAFALLAQLLGSPLFAEIGQMPEPVDEQKARNNLAQKLQTLSQSLDMREVSYPDSSGGGKSFNANDGNSFLSNSTYHSYVWDYCQQYAGQRNCQQWLDPYVSPHGANGDRSPLEAVVYDEWQRRRAPPGSVQNNGAQVQYSIWDIKRDPGAGNIQQADGRLNRTGITDMRLVAPLQNKVEQVGTDTAQRQINLTLDQGERNAMPNMEGLRLMAQRWTKMFRNRMVANLGELRANDTPIEVGLNEDFANCQAYAQATQAEFDPTDEKRLGQGRLDPETRGLGIQRRMQLCQMMANTPVQAVNPEVDENDARIQEGDPNTEQVDKWRSRVQIAVIDSAGRDPNTIPKPNNAPIERYEYESDIPDYAAGGLAKQNRRMTNADQLAGYNRNLREAAVGMADVAARGGIRDNSAAVLAFQIAPMTKNVVEINGLTPEMRGELTGTNFSQTASASRNDAQRPEKRLELTPSELTVRRLQ